MIFYIGVVLFLIYLWFKKKFLFWEERGFPYVPGKFPFGSVGEMGSKLHSSDVLKKLYDEHKGKTPALGMYFMTQPVLLPLEPELLKDIFVRNFESFQDRGIYLNEKDDPLSCHLFFLSGQKWKDLRSKLSPIFSSGKIKMMFGNVLKLCDRMIDYLEPMTNTKNGAIEMKDVLRSFGIEVVSSVAFGFENECLGNPDNEFRKVAKEIFSPPQWVTIKFFLMNSFQTFSKVLGLVINNQQRTQYFFNVIKKSIDYRNINNISRKDFLQSLMELQKNDSNITFNDIVGNSFVFFLAGFESSANTVIFSLYSLALNQDIQDKLRKEIDEVLSKHNGEFTYEGVMFEMIYLDMVMKETLRMYPGNDTQFRKCNKDFKIPNTKLMIPKDTLIMISANAFHRDERFFDNPNKFDPERFSYENVKKIQPYTYIPFSEGPRMCIGSRFGLMQTKISISRLIRNYKFTTNDKTTIPMKFVPNSAIQTPMGGMWLDVESINR